MAKFLFIRLSSMGDIVLTTPVVRCLKTQVPDAEIHYLVKNKHLPALKGNEYITKTYTFKDDLRKVVKQLQKEKYDYVIDLHNNLRSSYICMKLKAKVYTYSKFNIQKWLYTRLHINSMPKSHIVDRYMTAVKKLAVVNDMKGLDFVIRDKDVVNVDSMPENFNNGYISFVIGGTFFTKRLPIAKIISTINKLNKPVVLIGSDDDSQAAHEISTKAKNTVFNACGKYKLGQSASLLQQSLYVITHDTGMMHIAAALKKPIVSIWGNTTPEFGMIPYYGDAVIENSIMEIKDLKCRPCSKLGHSSCPKGHFKCMELIETTKIAEIVNKKC